MVFPNQLYVSNKDIGKLDTRFRAALINSLTGFKSVALIGTVGALKETNLAIFNSLVHIGANPPYIGFISRPDSAERHTMENILSTGSYTINHLNEAIYKQAHQTSARYPKDLSEFSETGLTEEYINDFKAPFVKESAIKFAVKFIEKHDFSINNTSLIVGQIESIYLPKNCLCKDGFIDIEKAGTITNSGLDSYHKTQSLGRLSYAKANELVRLVTNDYKTKIDE